MTLHLNQMLTIDATGSYLVQTASIAALADIAQEAVREKRFESHITFVNSADMIGEALGIYVPSPREKERRLTLLSDGDQVILVKPKRGHRPQPHEVLKPGDFTWWLITYRENL